MSWFFDLFAKPIVLPPSENGHLIWSQGKALHLPIDIQRDWLCQIDNPDAFAASVRQFASDVRPFMKTTWVACGKEMGVYSSAALSAGAKPNYAGFCSLRDQDIAEEEDIFIKRMRNAFRVLPFIQDLSKKTLAQYLREDGIETIVVTGISTRQCVASTVKGVLRNGFNCVVGSDLLADVVGEERRETAGPAPAYHEQLLKRCLGPKRSRRAIFTTRQQLLPALRVP